MLLCCTNLVEPVVDGPIELFGRVGSEHQHELVGLLSGPVEERVEGRAEVLRDLLRAALAQEGVGLVDKEDQALPGSLGPIEHLKGKTFRVRSCIFDFKVRSNSYTYFVHGSNAVPTHRCNVAPGQHCVVHPTVHRKLLGEHCLSGAGRAVEELKQNMRILNKGKSH